MSFNFLGFIKNLINKEIDNTRPSLITLSTVYIQTQIPDEISISEAKKEIESKLDLAVHSAVKNLNWLYQATAYTLLAGVKVRIDEIPDTETTAQFKAMALTVATDFFTHARF